ncbi:Ankyrin repeat-containing domain [Pseudocohnilembus persalinus]|uniref:Ankyrin repeat-containing domain n=1 Tax=Pseudocohnilembus persalinus TaxID=266149 RepID=A0A0V0QBT2_PSEPJ|nr:Ankyrin repeat-containing domain [Pseudocohnilembus persalinus]|eukprot:KRW99702.1 Ankyrin repeat-containing domain [Pseudocohnilembus persalinus]
MSKSRSKTPANKKNAPISFKKDHYYYYKQSDNEYLLFKAKENASDAPELKSFSILGEVSEDKTNIFYHLIKLKLQNFDAKNLLKDEISSKEVTKTIKGSKQNQVVVQKKVFKEIQDKGAKLQTEASKKPESESESESEEKEKKSSSRLGRSKTPVSKGKKTESQAKSTSKQAKSAVKESPQKQGKTREAAGKKGKKNGKEDDEEEEDYPLVQKRPSRAKDAFFNRRQKRQQQKQDKEDAEQEEEEDNQIDELDSSQPQDENEIEGESEESGKKSQKKKSSKKVTKKAAKPAKEVPVFKLGKWNQRVEFQEKSEIFDSTSDEIKDDCCATCTSKEIIRAANTGNMELFKKLLNSENKISNEYQLIGPENQVEIIELLIKLDDEEMLKYFANFINNTPKEFKRAQQPKCYLKNISTGYNNKFAYGRATRKVALGRGNKEGNNAFTYDLQQYRGFPYEVIQKVLRHAKNYKTLETLRLLNNFNIDHQLNQALSSAVQAGNFEIVKKIAENAHKRNKDDITQLHLDALSEDPNHKVSKHESNDILRNSYSYPPVTPIFLAAINPKTNKFLKDFLKENSQGLFQKDQNQKSLVHYAAACESPANLQALIEANANLKDITTDLSSALHFAAQYGRTKNVELLLSDEKYSDIKKKNKEGNHPIHLAAENGHVETIQAFLEKGVKLSLPGKDRMQMLHFAAAQNHLEVVKFIFEKKGKINSKDKFKRSPLVMAIRNNSIQVVSYLLSKGADFEQADSSNNTPLHYAAAYGSFESIELLLKAGADVNSVNSWNLTPLQIAQMKCHTRCLKYLIKQPNINVNCRDDEGITLLAKSVIQLYQDYENIDLNIEQIKFWLNANSDPNIADNSGKTPLHFIAEQSDKQYFISELVKKDKDYPIPQHQTFQAHKGYDYWNLSAEEIDTQEKEFKQKQDESLQAAYKQAQQENQSKNQLIQIKLINKNENQNKIRKFLNYNNQKINNQINQKIKKTGKNTTTKP